MKLIAAPLLFLGCLALACGSPTSRDVPAFETPTPHEPAAEEVPGDGGSDAAETPVDDPAGHADEPSDPSAPADGDPADPEPSDLDPDEPGPAAPDPNEPGPVAGSVRLGEPVLEGDLCTNATSRVTENADGSYQLALTGVSLASAPGDDHQSSKCRLDFAIEVPEGYRLRLPRFDLRGSATIAPESRSVVFLRSRFLGQSEAGVALELAGGHDGAFERDSSRLVRASSCGATTATWHNTIIMTLDPTPLGAAPSIVIAERALIPPLELERCP